MRTVHPTRPALALGGKPLLELDDVRVSYGGIKALKGIKLHVDQGEIVALSRAVFVALRWVFNRITRPAKSYESRDRAMAMYAPIGLLCLAASWVVLVLGCGVVAAGAGLGLGHLAVEGPTGVALLGLAILGLGLGLNS